MSSFGTTRAMASSRSRPGFGRTKPLSRLYSDSDGTESRVNLLLVGNTRNTRLIQTKCIISGLPEAAASIFSPVDFRGRITIIMMKTSLLVFALGQIFNWCKNGCKTTSRSPVANQNLWKKLEVKLREMEKSGMLVQFWKIPREWNEVDEYAKAGAVFFHF
jgi:ribonuclease HI